MTSESKQDDADRIATMDVLYHLAMFSQGFFLVGWGITPTPVDFSLLYTYHTSGGNVTPSLSMALLPSMPSLLSVLSTSVLSTSAPSISE